MSNGNKKTEKKIYNQLTLNDFLQATSGACSSPKRTGKILALTPRKSREERLRDKTIEKIIRYADRLDW